VHGLIRPRSLESPSRLDPLIHNPTIFGTRLFLHYGDLLDKICLQSLIQTVKPQELYNLAAQSHVGYSFVMPEYTAAVSGQSTVPLLETLRSLSPETRFYQASTSELYGKVHEIPHIPSDLVVTP
jgi:GDPmannose 4,6-dehydratase